MKVVWSPLAEQRALEAVSAIAADRPQAAVAWLAELLARVASLDRYAKRGRIVPEIGKATHRQVFHYPYRIIYRVEQERILIATVVHGSRLLEPVIAAIEGAHG